MSNEATIRKLRTELASINENIEVVSNANYNLNEINNKLYVEIEEERKRIHKLKFLIQSKLKVRASQERHMKVTGKRKKKISF